MVADGCAGIEPQPGCSAVYGMAEQALVSEGDLLAPINPYGASKMMSERMIADAAAAHPLKYVILRYFNVAGADAGGRLRQSNGVAATRRGSSLDEVGRGGVYRLPGIRFRPILAPAADMPAASESNPTLAFRPRHFLLLEPLDQHKCA
jgi:hypothetical protein